jgi:hypothetical protein
VAKGLLCHEFVLVANGSSYVGFFVDWVAVLASKVGDGERLARGLRASTSVEPGIYDSLWFGRRISSP